MGTLTALINGLASGAIEVIDLTAPLSADTPIIQLPPEFGQTEHFALEEISRYDERGPAWYWNNFRSGEHTGTHFDAPNHWVTGKELDDVASVPARRLIAPAVVLDFSERAAADADFLLELEDIKVWEQETRTIARGRLAAVPHRLGHPLERAGGVPQRGRDRPAHAGHLRRVRPLARRGGARHRRRESRPSAPTPAPPIRSTRPSRATPICWAAASTA